MATTTVVTLREAREDACMTQAELATESGVPRGTIYNWESGRCMPGEASLPEFRKVAQTLGVPAAKLVI